MTPEERALWARVIATVKPLERESAEVRRSAAGVQTNPPAGGKGLKDRASIAPGSKSEEAGRKGSPPPAGTLDASWDRQLSRGLVSPESMIDLHGHTLASAYARLDRGLEAAIARGDRVLLLVTGRPPRQDSERPHARGAIRAAVGDWLAASRHAGRIAAVRSAHPRHGGQGALYIILKRQRSGGARNS